jgi:flagellar protein FlaG
MDIGTVGSIAGNSRSVGNVGSQPQPAQVNAPVSSTANSSPVQTVNAVQQAASTPSLDQVKQAVDKINQSMHLSGLDFSFDPDSDRTIVKVIDKQTSEVIRQIPSEKAVAIAKSLDEAIGKLVKEKA